MPIDDATTDADRPAPARRGRGGGACVERVERPPRHEATSGGFSGARFAIITRWLGRRSAPSVLSTIHAFGGHMYENKSWRSPETASASEGAARPTSHALLRFECLAQRACEGVLRLLARVSGGRHVQRDVHLAPWWALVGAVGGLET